MTIRTGHNAQGHHTHHGQRVARTVVGYADGREPVVHVGIERQPDRKRKAMELPLQERHELIFEQVGTEPTKAAAIAKTLDMKPDGVNSSLYVLQDRGLVRRVQYKGWVRT